MSSNLLTVTEASRLSGLDRSWITRCIQAGRLKAEKLGPVYMIRRADLERFMEAPRLRGIPIGEQRAAVARGYVAPSARQAS